jgi:hypothetical protein
MPKNGRFSYDWLDDGGVVGPTAALNKRVEVVILAKSLALDSLHSSRSLFFTK